jgi:endonuclease YncB( thermonuclease family)
MKRWGRRLLQAGFTGLLSLTSNLDLASAQTLQATVLSIGDGDTLRVRQAGRVLTVRLACIDAPETAQSPWGQQARRYLQQRLALGRQVTLDIKTTDRDGRTVAEVISDSNIGPAVLSQQVVQ